MHTKLNIGCGQRYLPGWENIDFRPKNAAIRRWDLRRPLPYPDNGFDVVYSSHLLEHLKPEEARALLQECQRVLKPGGIVRVVVPDLEALARNYLEMLEKVRGRRTEDGGQRTEGQGRIGDQMSGGGDQISEIESDDSRLRTANQERVAKNQESAAGGRAESTSNAQHPTPNIQECNAKDACEEHPTVSEERTTTNDERYHWSVIFLIDQLCRTQTGGRMLAKLAEYHDDRPDFLKDHFNAEWLECVLGKTESRKQKAEIENVSDRRQMSAACGLWSRMVVGLRWRLRRAKGMMHGWVKRWLPKVSDWQERRKVARFLKVGERHQWMYDEISMGQLLADCGFEHVQRMTGGRTLLALGEEIERLDMTEAGKAYQPFSVYMEAKAPGKEC